MDFIRVAYKENKDGTKEFYPSLQALESSDLVIRGGQFVAIWDEDTGLYSRRMSHVPDIMDRSFMRMVGDRLRPGDLVRKFRVFDNQMFSRFLGLIRSIGDLGPELDQRIVFANEEPIKSYWASFKMPYALSAAPCPVWNEIIGSLYSDEERLKIEWAIGSIFSGASIDEVQKFYVFFGPPGSGKSTIMNVIEWLFEGHSAHFSAYEMGRADASFSLEPFKNNPLVAIDQDADLSRIEINKNLNSIVSHDHVLINAKGKNLYTIKPRATLFIGTNDPVKITNKKSGLFRRVVDIQPVGETIPEERYHKLMRQVKFELGGIAQHCMNVFAEKGSTFLSSYRSTDMMYRTNDIFNFVQDNRLVLEKGLTLKQAHKMYLAWCTETETKNIYKQFQFRDLLRDYFFHFHDQHMISGVRHRSYFEGLRELEKFSWKGLVPVPTRDWLTLDQETSIFDEVMSEMPAQYATEGGTPRKAWAGVTEKLQDIDTSKEHYVKVPVQHIAIDFDLKNELGEKDLATNLAAAALWPPTYAEVSRSGKGLHLHYDYDGDVQRLASVSPDGLFEVKTLLEGASLRRKMSTANGLDVATISSGLPLKEEKVLSSKVMSTEKGLRDLIGRALLKDINAGTKSNMDFIAKITDEAFMQGIPYDVSDMWDDILAFAMSSSNQRDKSLEIAMGLKLKSDVDVLEETIDDSEKPIAYYDLEAYPNLFAIGWIYDDVPDEQCVIMLNPTATECEELIDKLRRIGYNNRSYDAHMLYARSMGMDNQGIFELSQRLIVEKDRKALYGAAYGMDYADVYDMLPAADKKTLKKWEIELGLPHKEMDLPWDQPVPDDRVQDVLDYLRNDVLATREVGRARSGDLKARQILAQLSGLQVINTNRQHTEKMIFGDLRDTSGILQYTDLHEMFPGYKYDRFAPSKDKSTYKDEVVGEGGLVRSKPGMYERVAVLDIASMHPTSIIELNLFGEYTPKFKELLDIRLALKKRDFESAMKINPAIEPFITTPHEGYDIEGAKALSEALKTVINSVYGLTAASFPNLFRDPANIDNIVAKRGALFMMDLREFIEGEGFEVVHIKTDSVKIPGATKDIIDKVTAYAEEFGYTFEHEVTYDKLCLVNDAVYVACKDGEWDAVGAQFQHPIVFKTLFTKEDFVPSDYVETKQVAKGHMYLKTIDDVGHMQFIGRFGAFVPVQGGRLLLRVDGDKEHSVTGTKDYLWELDYVAFDNKMDIDMTYFQELVNEGMRTIEKFGSYADFTSVK